MLDSQVMKGHILQCCQKNIWPKKKPKLHQAEIAIYLKLHPFLNELFAVEHFDYQLFLRSENLILAP